MLSDEQKDAFLIALKITAAEDLEAQARRMRQQADEIRNKYGLAVLRPVLSIVPVVIS